MLYPYIQEAGLPWMLPIIFLSFIGLSINIERICYWITQKHKSKGRKQKLQKIYAEPFSADTVIKICRNTQDNLLQVIGYFVVNYNAMTLELAERKTLLFADKKVSESRQFLDILSLIASIAGTLGLMGTVVGISQSFKTLAREDPKGLAASLSTAMYTTIGGIILFLMSYLFLFFFEKIANHFEDSIDENIQRIKDCLEDGEKSQPIIFQEKEPIAATLEEPTPQNISSPEIEEKVGMYEKEA
ncbi:MotA/TolQ/ExbB proton channel family protein [Candidatus Uabimicrobium sp. HlEnr_7]|uniref:MotA/TolQ/ExbB proton channel family protein n=1 Tax=Candidatus Uabimicrobium helgolandensis TaxID=3095367 RepID=UPI003557C852